MDVWKNTICKVLTCDHYASRDIDLLPICGEHAWELAQHYQDILTQRAQIEERIDLRRENFRPSPDLYTHIAGLRAEHPLPHWASLPRTSTITRRHEETE